MDRSAPGPLAFDASKEQKKLDLRSRLTQAETEGDGGAAVLIVDTHRSRPRLVEEKNDRMDRGGSRIALVSYCDTHCDRKDEPAGRLFGLWSLGSSCFFRPP